MNEARHRALRDRLGKAWDLLDLVATDIDTTRREEQLQETVKIALDVGRQLGDGFILNAPSMLTPKACAESVRMVDLRLAGQRPRWRLLIPWILAMTLLTVGTSLAITCAALGAYFWREHSPLGLHATYYHGTEFEEQIMNRTEFRLERDLHRPDLPRRLPLELFSARWEGYLDVPQSATYRFFSQADDGIRVFLDDELLIDGWVRSEWPASGRHAEMHLSKGRHPIRIEYYQATGVAALRLRWTGGPIPRNTVVGAPYLVKERD